MNKFQPLDLQIKEASNRVYDLKDSLEKAKQTAFQEHEHMLLSGNKKRKGYDHACRKREAIKVELSGAEAELNHLKSIELEGKYRKEEVRQSYAGKNLLNIAFAIFGVCAVILLRKLFA